MIYIERSNNFDKIVNQSLILDYINFIFLLGKIV